MTTKTSIAAPLRYRALHTVYFAADQFIEAGCDFNPGKNSVSEADIDALVASGAVQDLNAPQELIFTATGLPA